MAPASVPSIMHASSESRTEGLNYYQRCLERDLLPDNFAGHEKSVIFVNFAIDTFVYTKTSGHSGYSSAVHEVMEPWRFNFEPEDLSRIQKVAYSGNEGGSLGAALLGDLPELDAVSELRLIVSSRPTMSIGIRAGLRALSSIRRR